MLGHIQTLGDAADRYTFMQSVDDAFRAKSNDEHRLLLDACYARDEASAVTCLKTHLGDARDRFAEMFANAVN